MGTYEKSPGRIHFHAHSHCWQGLVPYSYRKRSSFPCWLSAGDCPWLLEESFIFISEPVSVCWILFMLGFSQTSLFANLWLILLLLSKTSTSHIRKQVNFRIQNEEKSRNITETCTFLANIPIPFSHKLFWYISFHLFCQILLFWNMETNLN